MCVTYFSLLILVNNYCACLRPATDELFTNKNIASIEQLPTGRHRSLFARSIGCNPIKYQYQPTYTTMLTYSGYLKVKNNTVKVNDRFQKREFVITDDNPQYPNQVQFQLTGDRVSLLDAVNVGDELTVHFSLQGREWKNPQGEIKYFNTLNAFKIEKVTRTSVSESQSGSSNIPPALPTPEDDLPI